MGTDLGGESWYECAGLPLRAVRPMTARETRRMHDLMRLWSVIAVVALIVGFLAPLAQPPNHQSALSDLLHVAFMLAILALLTATSMVWRLWRCSRRRQVWVFEGEPYERPTGYFNHFLPGFTVGSSCLIEVWAGGSILTRRGDTVPLFGLFRFIPEGIAVQTVAAGETDFVGERPMTGHERGELARDLLGMLLNMGLRVLICLVVTCTAIAMLDRMPASLSNAGVLVIKVGLGLWLLAWLYDFWRIALITVDLGRGKCRRREGWDLVFLPWSRTPWSKEGRPAIWRLARRPITEVPRKARVTRTVEI